MIPIRYFLLLVIFCTGCSPQPDQELSASVLIQIDEKIAAQINFLQSECQEQVIQSAEAKVDSILLLENYLEKIEFFKVPVKPMKPGQVIIPDIEDTTPVKPILGNKDTLPLKQDSIL